MKGLVSMNSRELERFEQIQRVIEGRSSQRAAAERLSISYRQFKRLMQCLRAQCPQGITSRRRGRAGNHRFPEIFREHVLAIIAEHYADFGPTLARSVCHNGLNATRDLAAR